MSDVEHVLWTIVPLRPPEPWLACSRCGGTRPFRTSGRLRINANGKRLDAWLIYRCAGCEATWNRPVLQRVGVRAEPELIAALRANDPATARGLAFDVADLRRRTARVEEFGEVAVERSVLAKAALPARRLEIRLAVAVATGLRLDRLLAGELGLPRGRLARLVQSGALEIEPHGARMLRRPLRDGTRLSFDLAGAGLAGPQAAGGTRPPA